MHAMLMVAGVGLGLVLAAWGLWALVRHWDRVNAVLAAAPQLPIQLLNVGDAAWVRGRIECEKPLHVPHFGHGCVHFSYKLEEEVRRTRRRSDGSEEVYYEWETRDTQSGISPFSLRQEDEVLAVDVDRARWHYESTACEKLGKWRHSCSYMPYPGEASAAGVVSEKKKQLEPRQHVPLIVTPLDRKAYLEAAEAAERWTARVGLLLLFLGFLGFAYGLIRYGQSGHESTPHLYDAGAAWLALAAAVAGASLFWFIRTYNSLVTFRRRADQGWSGIDIHLKQRYDLIPKLVECVKGYVQHERTLFEHLVSLRTEALAGGRTGFVRTEGDTLNDLDQLAITVESYPTLKADQLFRQLAAQITAIEAKIAHARTFYNDSVMEYNTNVAQFPANLVARMGGFKPYPLFATEVLERAPLRIAVA